VNVKHAILVVLVGCEPPVAQIPEGSTTSLGQLSTEDPAPTDDPSGVVWVDAEGTVVEEVVELPEGLAFEDPDGFYWALDPNGAEEDALVPFPEAGYVRVQYVDAGCDEPRILGTILPPRYVMRGPAQGRSFVAQDDAVPQQYTEVYDMYAGQCSGIPSLMEGLTYDDVVEVVIPAVYWVPPLHPETL
jgi:hypothetical protein